VAEDIICASCGRDRPCKHERAANVADRPPVSREPRTAIQRLLDYSWGLHLAGTPNEAEAIGLIEAARAEARATPPSLDKLAELERRLMTVLQHGHDLEKPGVRTALWIVSEIRGARRD
jgi:hypothetical protein